MYTDPIIDEIRKHREQFAAKFHYDISAMIADLRHRQENRENISPKVDKGKERMSPKV